MTAVGGPGIVVRMRVGDEAGHDPRAVSITVLTTGGTIAARTDGDGVVTTPGPDAAAGDGVAEAVRASLPPGVGVTVRRVLDVDSAQLGPAELDLIRAAVADALADPGCSGVVVTHGTDTLEETAMALDLVHGDPRPVVVTGAQRAADHPEADGPDNLRDALGVVADPISRDLGVLVVFGRAVLQARGTRKWHTEDLVGFARQAPDPTAEVDPQTLPAGLARPVVTDPVPLAGTRVDLVAAFPGADDAAVRAAVEAGARGLVVEGLGSGNVPAALADGLRAAMAADPGLVVVLSTRVPRGPVAARYGGAGGGADLARAGVLTAGYLRSGQARVLLQTLLGAERARCGDAETAAAEVRRRWDTWSRVTA